MPRLIITNNSDRYRRHHRGGRGNPLLSLLGLFGVLIYYVGQELWPTTGAASAGQKPLFPELQAGWAQFMNRLNALTPTQWAVIGGALFLMVAGLIGVLIVLTWNAGQQPNAERQAWEAERQANREK